MSQSPRKSTQGLKDSTALAPQPTESEPKGAPGMFDKHREAIKGAFEPQKVTDEMKMMTDVYIEKKHIGRPVNIEVGDPILVTDPNSPARSINNASPGSERNSPAQSPRNSTTMGPFGAKTSPRFNSDMR